MEITIRSKNFSVSPAIKSYAEEKLQKLEKYSKKIIEAHVMFSVERYRHIAEIVLRVNGGDVTGRGESTDMYASIDTVVDKLERMLNKRKEKISRKRQRKSIRDTGLEGAAPNATSSPDAVKVVPQQMTVDEAMEELERREEEILVFVNSATSRTTVLHRRSDGSFTLIEPVN
jgi:putative sigma-54 modulation protein